MDRRELVFDLRDDLRLALRLFRRSPMFFAAAAFTLAIGIGANGAVFSIFRSALLAPLPYRDPSRLMMIWRTYPNAPKPPGESRPKLWRGVLTSESLAAWKDEVAPQVGDVAAVLAAPANLEAEFDLTLGDRTDRLHGAMVTPNFFDLLGVRAQRGRVFHAADESSDAPTVVLSHSTWTREFGADSSVIGRLVTLTSGRAPRTERRFVIAGVLPPNVHFTYPEETQIWSLMHWSEVRAYPKRALAFDAVTRLAPGVSLTQANARAAQFQAGLGYPGQKLADRPTIELEPMHEWIVGTIRPSLRLLAAVALLLLVVTCVTVANGLLARVAERRQELAVRLALGAARMRLVRQLVTEGVVLSVVGTGCGLLLSVALQPVLRSFLPASVPRVGDIGMDAGMLAFGAGMAFVVTILAALAPAIGGTNVEDAPAVIRAGSRHASAAHGAVRWRQLLVGAQAAIATALLISASLLLASFWRLGRVPLGFDADKVVTVEMRLLDPKYRDSTTLRRFQDDLLAAVSAIPGVTDAGLASAVPFRGVDFLTVFGTQETGPKPANQRFVDPGYFRVLGVPLRRGRLISAADREGAPAVAVISESFARMAYGNDDPVGKPLPFERRVEVVGVVGDVRYVGRDKDPTAAVYLALAQSPSTLLCVVARTPVGIGAVGPAIRRAVHDIDPSIPAMRLTTIDRIVDETMANRRFYTMATASFASLALVLTVVGLAVVVARAVAERRRELAIRSALGATMNRLATVAARDVLVAVVVGVVLGGAAVYVAANNLTQFLFHVTPRSPVAYSSVASLVLGIAILSAWLPVRRFGRLSLATLLANE